MADRQLVWLCSNCGNRRKNKSGESIPETCVECDRTGFRYTIHDENLGFKLRKDDPHPNTGYAQNE